MRRMLATIEKQSAEKEENTRRRITDETKRIKLVGVSVFGTSSKALFDSGAVLKVTSATLCGHLGLEPEPTARKVKMTDGSEAVVDREVTNVQLSVRDSTCRIIFLVLSRPPY